MAPGGLRCNCGNHGCLEAYASDRAVLDRCGELLAQGRAPRLRELCGTAAPAMEHVLAALEQGDGDVAEVVEQAVYILGVAVANINNFACPDKNTLVILSKTICFVIILFPSCQGAAHLIRFVFVKDA